MMANKEQISNLTDGFLGNNLGNYRILPSGAAYCSGVVPDAGFEVVRAELRALLPLEDAYAFIESYLASVNRPVQAFCGIELRVPAPLSMNNWASFNVPYIEQLRKWGLVSGNLSCVCRSNIALDLYPPERTSMCAFSYTTPASASSKTFILSGQADIGPDGNIIADGNVRAEGMLERTHYVIDAVSDTLSKLRLTWEDTTRLALFHAHEIPGLWSPQMLGRIGKPLQRGVLIYRARPPIVGGEVELEARGVRQELVLPTA